MDKLGSQLPEDLVLNILLRLPFICFFRFMSVCKSWYSLLSDPVFMYKNLTFIKPDSRLQLLMNQIYKVTGRGYFNDLSLISFHDVRSKTNLSFTHEDWVTVVGSYNGLVCLTDHKRDIFFWNPLTDEINVLLRSPNFTDSEIFDERFEHVCFDVGFCFDADTNDYKVIKIFHPEHWNNANVVFLYSSRSNRWKKLDFSLKLEFACMGQIPISCNGKFYHWIADPTRLDTDGVVRVIVSFDMNLESMKTTEVPYILNHSNGRNLYIEFFMLKDFVAAYSGPWESYMAGTPIFEISVLLRIGVKESWTKLITIDLPIAVDAILLPWKNGSLFLKAGDGNLVIFDPFDRVIIDVVVLDYGRTAAATTTETISYPFIRLMAYKGAHVQ